MSFVCGGQAEDDPDADAERKRTASVSASAFSDSGCRPKWSSGRVSDS